MTTLIDLNTVIDYLVSGAVVFYFVIWIPLEWWMVNRHVKRGEELKYNRENRKREWVKKI